MATFEFQVRDGAGKSSTGVLAAADVNEASRMLRSEGNTIVSLAPKRAEAPVAATRIGRVKRDDVIFFATQLAVLVDTGVPLAEALDSIADQTEGQSMKAVLEDVSSQVKSGVEFSAALMAHPKVFSKLFAAMMKASEASGTMGQMLQRVSEYLGQERETRKQIKGAMTYPVCMLSFCVLVVVGLLTFVLPRFESIYAGKGATLPLPTRILLGASNALVHYWPFIVVTLTAAVVGGYFYFKSASGRILLDGARINLPIIGPMYRKAYLSRSLRTLATMVGTGVSILDGLAITAQVAGNHFFEKVWTDLSKKVQNGSTLSENLMQCKLVPRTVSQMVSAGERTGKLGHVMNRAAAFCEDDLRIAIKTMTSMIEPAMIIFMGLLIGGIAISLLLPIFSISKVVAGGK